MKKEYTLTEVSKLLQVPQHRLIYLCEAKVIIPDKSDAKGRGSSRRFSERNLLEFWVALTLSEFHVPAYYSTKILTTLRSFAKEVGKLVPTFQFPSSLTDANLPQINLLITNGTRLFFVLNLPNARPIVLGGVDLNKQTQKMQLVNIEIAFERKRKSNQFGTIDTSNIWQQRFLHTQSNPNSKRSTNNAAQFTNLNFTTNDTFKFLRHTTPHFQEDNPVSTLHKHVNIRRIILELVDFELDIQPK